MDKNINDQVRVELTTFGVQVLREHYAAYENLGARWADKVLKEGNVYEAALWQLMEIFGPRITMCAPELPFKNNKITFK